jgi:hypothetical protein
VLKLFLHHKVPGALHWGQVLPYILHLIPSKLGSGHAEINQTIGKLGHAILIGCHPRPELAGQSFTQLPLTSSEIPITGAELLAAGSKLGGLVIVEAQLLLHPGGKSLLDSLPE